MGIYINAGNDGLKEALNSEIFVDKSLILKKFCSLMNTKQKFICVSRPRRFGKTTVRNLMEAFFSKGCDSSELFKNLKIAKETCFKENLNKYNVLSIDMGFFYSNSVNKNAVLENLRTELLEDFQNEFKDIEFSETDSIAKMIQRAYDKTNTKFIVTIDEYDVIIREKMSDEIIRNYRELLNSLFKGDPLSKAISFAYITGILPIIRDKVQSKLNNFKESTMLNPVSLEEFFGFTKNEVKTLCKEYKMKFKECENWYDGYKIGGIDIYNPNSVVHAMTNRKYMNYWTISGSYEAISDYIKLDFDGVKSGIIDMLSGREIAVITDNFSNSLNDFKDKNDIFTYLIHLGYLNFNEETKLCRIPNREVRQEWEKAVSTAKSFSKIAEMIENSDRLLYYTQKGNAEKVAEALDEAHTAISSAKDYNNEACMQSAIMLAYFTAKSKYTVIREMPTGYGFADIGFIPLNPSEPAMVIELKYDKDEESAIDQIKNKKYPAGFENYLDNLLLVGVNYDKKTKVHECVIEKYQG